jgi:glucose/arabinose dehydrogenase
MAFHPNYAENGWFFIYYTAAGSGANTVARYTRLDTSRADPASAQIILSVDDPYPNHNAGQLAFGPDGYLYVGLGDGGSAGDPHGNGQNTRVLLGKMLRLDVNGELPYRVPEDNPFVDDANFRPEIWAWGLRNPWRYSFDRVTGDLYIADVGQYLWEEINFQPADSSGGENYGWSVLEGSHAFSGETAPSNAVMPIAEYSHADGCSVTGGYVYRGGLLPELQGVYFFGDWCTGITWTTRREAAGNWQTNIFMNTGRQISSFGEDVGGELYLVDYDGVLLRLERVEE